MQNLACCVLGRLTYIQYASPPDALQARTCVCMGGT